MSTPLEIVITKKSALAVLKEEGYFIRKAQSGGYRITRHGAQCHHLPILEKREDSIAFLIKRIMSGETLRPVRVQF